MTHRKYTIQTQLVTIYTIRLPGSKILCIPWTKIIFLHNCHSFIHQTFFIIFNVIDAGYHRYNDKDTDFIQIQSTREDRMKTKNCNMF